jgi:predicted ribosomally synthesized peptide with nif11-like leader
MSQAHVEQFAARVKNDPAMFNKLVAGTQTPGQFIDKAIALGKETGFTFTKEEADGWVQQQIKAKQNGELSDLQLESVAGGKESSFTAKGSGSSHLIPGSGDALAWIGGNIVAPIDNWLNAW